MTKVKIYLCAKEGFVYGNPLDTFLFEEYPEAQKFQKNFNTINHPADQSSPRQARDYLSARVM